MKYSLKEFATMDTEKVKEGLLKCCGSTKWVEQVAEKFPFEQEQNLFDAARSIWFDECEKQDYLEAFSHHPKIGDTKQLEEKFKSTTNWAENEQRGVANADESLINELAKHNQTYFEKFGFVYLICATGKPAKEMLQLLIERLKHESEEELAIAKGEQFKITLLRLQKLIDLKESFWNSASQITTHVLDTSIGVPGKNICIRLKRRTEEHFKTIAIGCTNADGRIANLLAPEVKLEAGHYQMCFDTKAYFNAQNIKGFYPKVDIDFNTFDQSHYHVPLLINPFGYSTYRGS